MSEFFVCSAADAEAAYAPAHVTTDRDGGRRRSGADVPFVLLVAVCEVLLCLTVSQPEPPAESAYTRRRARASLSVSRIFVF